jgi:predicted enzyme related to lactoylglutathione lyase
MTAIVVRPVRFTDSIEPMRAFLELLGMRVRIESQRGGWYDLVAGAGMVGLHRAAQSSSGHAHGETTLSFEADDCATLAERLRSAGVPDVVVYDEAYGQVLTCTDPLGDIIAVDGRSRDLYGYTLHQARAEERLAVQPVRFTDPLGPYAAFLDQLGFIRRGHADEFFATHGGDGDSGLVGLHYVYDGDLPIVPGAGAVHLTFTTTEPIGDVAKRLSAAGFEPTVTHEEFGSVLSVIDPDGLEVQVHELAET